MTTDLPEAAKPDHLTDALRRHGVLSTGRVRDVTTDAPRDLLMSRIVRLKLAYDGPAEKAPASLILKTWGPRDGVPEAWAAREVLFYDTVAPVTPASSLLRCFDAGWSPESKAWHLLLEDMTDSHCIAADRPLPPTEPQCRAIVGVLAHFHAAWWDRAPPGLSLGAEAAMALANDLHQPLPGFWASLCDRLGDRMSGDRRRLCERFFAAPPHFARLATALNLSVVHGDAHVWNVFLPNDGRAGGERLFDWGAWRPGLPAIDLACMMAMHWFPEHRRRFERPLLDHYHATLLASGVEGYDRAALDHDYRLAVLIQMTMPIIWANIGMSASVWLPSFERIMLAVDDLGCRDLLA